MFERSTFSSRLRRTVRPTRLCSSQKRYLGDAEALARHPVQVPLVVNHKQKFISFGGDCPQLCFKYRMTDAASGRSVQLDQRFVFSLSWSPEDFRESVQDVGPMVESGELELF